MASSQDPRKAALHATGRQALAPHVAASIALGRGLGIQSKQGPVERRSQTSEHVKAAVDRSFRVPLPATPAHPGGQPRVVNACLVRPSGPPVVQRAQSGWFPINMTGIAIEEKDPVTKGMILDPVEYYARRNIAHEVKPRKTTGNPGRVTIFLEGGKKIIITSASGAKEFEGFPVLNIEKIYTDDTRGVPLGDKDKQRKLDMLAKAANGIQQALAQSDTLVVHCRHGRSRSPSAVGAYLMMHCRYSAAEALREIVQAFGVKATVLAHRGLTDGPPLHATLATVPKAHESSDFENPHRPELNVEQDLKFLASMQG